MKKIQKQKIKKYKVPKHKKMKKIFQKTKIKQKNVLI